MEAELEKIYYDPKDPGSYGGKEALLRRAKEKGVAAASFKSIDKFLKTQDTYTLHAPVRKRFSRNQTIVSGIDKQWQADLADLSNLSGENDGFRYLLTVVDCFSKFAWAIPMKKKDTKDTLDAFKQLFAQSAPRKPERLHTDKGLEFTNVGLKRFYTDNGVHHFVNASSNKAAMVERFNRTLKTKMYRYFTRNDTKRYIDVLPDLLHSYNHSKHRTIGMAPAQVTKADESKLWHRVYGSYFSHAHPTKFSSGDQIRISSAKTIFDKGYLPSWTKEVFKVKDVVHHPLRVYKITDQQGEDIEGSYYPQDVQSVVKTEQELYRVDKVLKRRTLHGVKEALVKWIGYPAKFNRWIDTKELARHGVK